MIPLCKKHKLEVLEIFPESKVLKEASKEECILCLEPEEERHWRGSR
jgi:hypothetical protein